MIRRGAAPELIVALASAAWGLFWIPLRALDRSGLDPGWVIVSQFAAPLAVLLPFAILRWRRGEPSGGREYATGLLVGGAVVLYSESLLLTEVARALILFYAMPAWGTLVEVGLMGRRFSLWRGLALVLSLGGLFTILGLGGSFPFTMNLGDLMALASGIVFTFGAMRIRQTPHVSVFEQVFAFFLFGSLVALGLAALAPVALGGPPDGRLLLTVAPWFVLIAVGFLIPVMWGIYWGSRHVDPGRLGILLQLEAVVGIGSAALFAGEPFGLRHGFGAALVIAAGLVEVIMNRTSAE